MRGIKEIILHCSATKEGKDFGRIDIDRWHREQGFYGIGYHYVIRLDGTIEKGRELDVNGAHCANHNTYSVGICYIGGLDADGKAKDTRTPEQKASMHRLVDALRTVFNIPETAVHCHNEYAAKACPCFSMKDF